MLWIGTGYVYWRWLWKPSFSYRLKNVSLSHAYIIKSKAGNNHQYWVIDTTSDSQVNSHFLYRWSPVSLTFNNYFYLLLYLYIPRIIIKNQNRRTAFGRPAMKLMRGGGGGDFNLQLHHPYRLLTSFLWLTDLANFGFFSHLLLFLRNIRA